MKKTEVDSAASSSHNPDDWFIVYYDGKCGFCNRSVNFLLNADRPGSIRYAALQGETARQQLGADDIQRLNTLVATHKGKSYRRSTAVVRILWQLGRHYRLLGWMLWLIPLPLRDLGYRVLARWRYSLFGTVDACRLPKPGEQQRFLE
ncbi:thiol-disulfide oxidoreductase DCC family protein [Planctomicrobium sp. SH668]|uniref:thiol-disulfide oxidoreductase DCC family protein n=1 Tax=Planctomicrobium sp. SH668 TaxID=3448126 RepID=UPI003F5AF0F0